MANHDKRTSHLSKLVSAARGIVTYQVGLPLGCTRIQRILFWLRPFEQLDFPVFDQFLAAARDLPLGTERLHWSRDALRKRDIELDRIIRRGITAAGLAEPTHPVAHGVGARAHEPPYAHQAGGGTIEEGMVLAIEPGAYWDGGGGLRVEDNFLVTSDGVEKLSAYPDDFR